jgi:amino-acid N-acetyltransferase
MSTSTEIRRARPEDLSAIERLLTEAHLLVDGARAAFQTGFVAEDRGRIIGGAALECFEDGALLRSVVVDPSARGQGLGQRLTVAAVDEASSLRLPAVYLLTTTAEDFFPKLGFVRTTRDAVPRSVQQSVEFQSACCASAAVFARRCDV